MHRQSTFLLHIGIALWAALLAGCQNNRAVIPPPGAFGGGDPYYQPTNPAAASAPFRPGTTGNAPISLAPTNSQASANKTSRALPDTYDVTARTAQDNQPIRVIDGSGRISSVASSVRGMPVNDGTNATSFQARPSATISQNPFGGMRGTALDTRSASNQGFSGQDGQWRSRSSYEGTERR